MADVFLTEDVKKLFLNKFVVVMGGSVHRSIYKDLVMLLQKNKYLNDDQLRAKGEPKFENDELLEGGQKGVMRTNNNYREVRQYKTNHHLVRFYFLTRCYNNYVEKVLQTLSQDPKPDVIIISTILWDITRYGNKGVQEYKNKLEIFFDRIKKLMTKDCLLIWNTAPPVSKEAKGGIFTPEVEHLRSTFRLEVLEANYYAYKTAVKKGYNVLDLHYFLRLQLHRRAEDGIHWDMTAHRRISNLLLTIISEQWKVPLPGNVQKMFKKKLASGITNNKTTLKAGIEKDINGNPLAGRDKKSETVTNSTAELPKARFENKLNNVKSSVQNSKVQPQKPKAKKKKKKRNGPNMKGPMMPHNWNTYNEYQSNEQYPKDSYPLPAPNCGSYNINDQLYPMPEYFNSFPQEQQLPVEKPPNFHWQPYSCEEYEHERMQGPMNGRYHPYSMNERQFPMQQVQPPMYQPEYW